MNSGGRIRSVQTIRALSQRDSVTVVSFYRMRRRDFRYEERLRDAFPGSIPFWLGNSLRSALVFRFPGRFTGSLAMTLRAPRKAKRVVAELLASGQFDVAICDFVFSAALFPDEAPIPCVLHEHNVEYASMRSLAPSWRNFPTRLASQFASFRLKRFERKQVQRFARTLAVSEEDAGLLRALAPRRSVTPMGTGVDLDEYVPSPLPEGPAPLVVFTGLMQYHPNVDAVVWFCHEIWPRVVSAVPEARFRIVGRNPSPSVRALASESIEVTGRVESVAEHLRQASVVVVPIRSGGGTRLKIYEAMACARPIVSTSLGAEGLDVSPGEDIVIAESAEAFADEVVRVLTDRPWAESLGAAAGRKGMTKGWGAVADVIGGALEAVVAPKSRSDSTASRSRRQSPGAKN